MKMPDSAQELKMNFRYSLQWVLILLAIAVLSSALATYVVFRNMGDKVSILFESITGMKCVIATVHPCFPFGIKASGITIYSMSGEPLLQAKEISAQVNLLDYLLKSGKRSELFNNLEGDQIKLTITRNESGEWDIPLFIPSKKIRGSATDGKASASRRHISLTNFTISIKTGKGESTRIYKSMEAYFNPENDSVTVKLSGADESAHISFKNGEDNQYEIHAENFSMALLAPLSASPFPLENLILNGKIRATSNDNKRFVIEASGRIMLSKLNHALLSSTTIYDLNLPFDLSCTLTSTGINNLSGKIDMAGETAIINGKIEGWEKPVIDMTVSFTDFSYDRAISALPVTLHPSLPVIRLSGKISGAFSMHIDTGDPDSLDFSYNGHIEPLEILDLGQGVNIDHLKTPFLHNVRTKAGKHVYIMLSPGNPDFIPYRKIPASLICAVMSAEDGSFFSHKGFSKRHIKGSLIENMKAGKVIRGASTISMQLAKNLYLSPERTLSRKLEEALITVALEQNLDKRRILEIYLNIIEWGNDIYGIGPASQYYFGKWPEELRPVESAFLASIIARPRSNWRPDPLSKISQSWKEYLQVILCKMYERGGAEVEDLLEAGVSESRIGALSGR